MTGRRSICGTLLVLLAVRGGPVAAADPPPLSPRLISAASLTPQQLDVVSRYAEGWCDQLTSASPAQVRTARGKLIDPLIALSVGGGFRYEYSKVALPRLEKIIQGDNSLAAVNAMQVTAYLGTPRALTLIVNQGDILQQERDAIRLFAAKAFPTAVQQGAIPESEVNKGLRSLGQAARREANWLILRRQFDAIASVPGEVSRDEQVRVLRAITRRIMTDSETGPSELMQAIYPALKLVRDEYLELAPVEQKSFGTALAPILCELYDIANAHWDTAQDDPQAKLTYGGAIHISENLLRLIDGRVRPRQQGPQTALNRAWTDRDEPSFDADHRKWKTVLSNPPYKGP